MELAEFNKLKIKAEKDVRIDKENLLTKTYDIAINYQKYLDVLSNQRRVAMSLEQDLDKVYAKFLKFYKYEDSYEWKTQKEIDAMIMSEDEYIEIAQKVNFQKVVIEYLDKLLKNISQMTFNIREIRELTALLAGKGF